MRIELKLGDKIKRDQLLRKLTDLQYERSRADFKQGMFHVMGDTVEIFPPGGDTAVRLEFWDEDLETITEMEPFTGEVLGTTGSVTIFPAKHAVTTIEKIEAVIPQIQQELELRCEELKMVGKGLEAARLRSRTEYDIEILRETGYVSGIENYVRYFSDLGENGQAPTLMDYFPDDFLMVIDESHMTIPQLGAMFNGNLSRKQSLVEFGFRLPSAFDNRPLQFSEFESYMNQAIFVSATPGKYEMEQKDNLVEQIIRPTGLIDPRIEVRSKTGQMDNLMEEIRQRILKKERVLVTTLTKCVTCIRILTPWSVSKFCVTCV
jgi:excinuclease ABC subunit B